MTSIKIKAAYILFSIFFSIWLALIVSVCFPSGTWTYPIRFPSLTLLALFLGSAVMSSVACLVIGFDYLGIDNGLIWRIKKLAQTPKANRLISKRMPTQETKNRSICNKSEKQSQDVPMVMVIEE